MPPKKIDQGTLIKAINWSLRFFLDPKNRRVPTEKELEQQFPGSNITQEQVEQELQKLLGVKNLEEVGGNATRAKVEEILEKTYQKEEGGERRDQKEAKAQEPTHAPTAKPVGALGVLAELETIEPFLEKHMQEFQPRLAESLAPQIEKLLPELGVKNTPAQTIEEIATETARQVFEDAAKIKTAPQIDSTVVDSLAQTIITHPQIAPQVKAEDAQLLEKTYRQIAQVTEQNRAELEKTAVLASLQKIAAINTKAPDVKTQLSQNVEDLFEIHSALTPPNVREETKTNIADFISNYQKELFGQLEVLQKGIPTFEDLQKAKETAHREATKALKAPTIQVVPGKKPITVIAPQVLTGRIAQVYNLAPTAPFLTPPKMPTGSGLVLSNPTRVNEAYLSLLSQDQDKLQKALKESSDQIEKYKQKKSLSYRERKAYWVAQKQHDRYVAAQAFHVKKAKRAQAYRTLFAQAYGGRPELASQNVWFAEQQLIGTLPKMFAANERLAAGTAFGSLGFSIAGFSPGAYVSRFFSQMHGAATLGMGITPKSLITHNPISAVAGKIKKVMGATLGGLYLLALGLGKAAFTGAVIGSVIGTGAGAAFGVAILAPLGPLGWAAMPVVVPMTALTGGVIGGLAGMLIGLGIASGSAALISMGIGAGAGGTIGAVIGFNLGVALGAGVMTFLIGLCIGSLVCAPFAPILIAVSPVIVTMFGAVGAAVGAVIGTIIGTIGGYLIGNYLINPIVSGIKGAINALEGGVGAGGGILGSIGSFLTGLASTVWGGISSIGGGILGALTGGVNLVVSGLAALPLPAALPVVLLTAGPVGGAVFLTSVITSGTAVTFATIATEEDTSQIIPGQNEFFTLTKISDVSHLDNPLPDKAREVTFTVSLTAKELNLTNVSVTDQINVRGEGSPFGVTTDRDGNPISPGPCPQNIPAGGNCTFSYTITVDSRFVDATIANTATVTATPEGKAQVTDSASISVTVGNPPAQCPRGWPAIGDVTQGPEGATSHAPFVYEAIDIGQGFIGGVGKPVYATVEGTVVESFTNGGNSLDQRIGVQPTSCVGLDIVYYWHLSARSVSVGQIVTHGQQIGATGQAGTGPHIHYQFNRSGNRNFAIAPPHIPKSIPRTCDSPEACNTRITSAP